MRALKIPVIDNDRSTFATLNTDPRLQTHSFIDLGLKKKDVFSYLASNHVDLLLLNTTLLSRGDGIDMARQICAQYAIPIIFIRDFGADSNLFWQAKQLMPYAYLSKPIDVLGLQYAIELTFMHFHQLGGSYNSDKLSLSNSYFVRIGNKLKRIKIDEIKWVMVEDKYSTIFTNELHVPIKLPLKNIIQKLPKSDFLQIHRNYIINLNKINNIDVSHNQLVIDEKTIPISRTYRDKLIGKLQML